MRLELRDGQWADLRERPTLAQANLVRAAYVAAGGDSAAVVDIAAAAVAAYVSDWHVLGEDGHELGIDQVQDAPDDVVQAIAAEALRIFRGAPDPKGSTAPSASPRRARRSSSGT